jgi:hypothetical protein
VISTDTGSSNTGFSNSGFVPAGLSGSTPGGGGGAGRPPAVFASVPWVGAALDALLGTVWNASQGSGRMAARGAAAGAAQLHRYESNLAALGARELAVQHAFEQANPGGVGYFVESNPDPKLTKLLVKIGVAAHNVLEARGNRRREKKFLAQEHRLEMKLAKRQAAVARQTDVRYAELYGPNAGYWLERGAPPPLWLVQ